MGCAGLEALLFLSGVPCCRTIAALDQMVQKRQTWRDAFFVSVGVACTHTHTHTRILGHL